MCYDIAYFTKKIEKYQERFGVDYGPSEIMKVHHTSGFSHNPIPVITNDAPDTIQMFNWGLIPFWVKDIKSAARIQNSTLNARDNTLFEKPSFRAAAKYRRCLVIVDGFYDHHWQDGKSFPFYIKRKDNEPFAMGGIWEVWDKTGEARHTVAIITTDPNSMLKWIHNKPAKSETSRMPFILTPEMESTWIDSELTREEASQMILPFPDEELTAHPVKRLRGKQYPGNVPEIQEEEAYEDLEFPENWGSKEE